LAGVFSLPLDAIQPSQLYISRLKLDLTLRQLEEGGTSSLEPIPIKILDGEQVATDGHTRGVALLLSGERVTDCVWEDLEMDWEEYRICVRWCKESGIQSMEDLLGRVISHSDYKIMWLERCRIMQDDLAAQRHCS
jgi:hypothetical protein